MKKILLLPLLLLSIFLSAQTPKNLCTIEGTITDGKTSETLPFVNVVIDQNGKMITGGLTDFDGKYKFTELPEGEYEVRAVYIGYENVKISGVLITAETTKFVDLKLGNSRKEGEKIIFSCCMCCCFVPGTKEEPTIDLFKAQELLNDSIKATLPSVGLGELTTTREFTVFPNPSQGMVTLSNIPNISEITLMDINGKLLRSFPILEQKQLMLDLTLFQPGVYLVKYEIGNEVVVRKLIKR